MAAQQPRRYLTVAAATVAVAVVAVAVVPNESRAFVLGLGSGCLVAAIALGIIVTYRGSGVINFASGAMATYSAYAYNALRQNGSIFLPPLPHGVSFGGPLGFWPALLVTLVLSALLGLVCHVLVFRPLRGAPPVMKLVASVGVLLTLQAVVILRFGSLVQPTPPVIPSDPVHLPGGITIPSDQLILTAIIAVLVGLLWAVFSFTRFGLATRAAAENERGAVILGFSPQLLAGANWVLSSTLVGLLGVLVASVNGSIDPSTITLLVVPALGAALIGGFDSLCISVLAAFGIAMAQNLVQYLSILSWFPQTSIGPLPGVSDLIPLLVIFAVLFRRGRSLPARGLPVSGRLPSVPQPSHAAISAAIMSAACVAGLLALSPAWRLGITNSLIGATACLSLVVLTGFAGQVSLAQLSVAGISGFTLAKLSSSAGVPFPLAPLCGSLAATAIGLLLAIPAIRIRGVSLAILTLAGAVAMQSFVFTNPDWSGGGSGAAVPPPRLGPAHFGPSDPGSFHLIGYTGDRKLPDPWFGIFCLLVLLILAVAVINLRRSATGRRLLAVRSNERAAAAAGISVPRTKLLGFGISAFIAGTAGALAGYGFGSVSPDSFGAVASLTLLAFAFIGGITSVTGAIIGGLFVAGGLDITVLQQLFGLSSSYTLLIAAIGLTLNAVLNPEGIAGAAREIATRAARLLRSRPGPGGRNPAALQPTQESLDV